MKNAKPNRRKAVVLLAFAAIIALMSLQLASSARTAVGVIADADLSAEDRILESFVTDLARFNKKHSELGKKTTLTRTEFDAHQRDADSLKNRVSGVQNALREVIRKLKAAGQWDNLDQIVLAKFNNSTFQDFVRRDGFKRTLEEAASNLSSNANDISRPLDLLRSKIQAQAGQSDVESDRSNLALRAVRVAHRLEPAAVTLTLKCRAASVRFGIAGFVHGATEKANKAREAYNCACFGSCNAQ